MRGYTTADQEQAATLFGARASAGADASVGSGGPMNDNLLFINSFHAAFYFRSELSLSVDLLIYNYLRYAVPDSASDPALASTGRSDATWGIIELSYQPRKYVVWSLGISSLQRALTADGKAVRFPFYDFISPWSNYTRWYLSAAYIY